MRIDPPAAAGVLLTLPGWLVELLSAGEILLPDPDDRMGWVIGLSRRNVEEGTGGPFAAAVFESLTGRLLGAGVNRVEPLHLSPAHAEILSIAFAQERRGCFDLGGDADLPTELVASAQPCLMCLGAVLWSGVTRLVYGASAADVTGTLGFDEGPLPAGWIEEFRKRGIEVEGGRRRSEAAAVLDLYRARGGTVYNSRRGRQR
jgi:tRNA(Arg) A34 adenosine deaminase TadA